MAFRGRFRSVSPRVDKPKITTATSAPVIDLDNTWPPVSPTKDETSHQREQRLQAEREAKRVSDAIDREIEQDRAERKRRKAEVRILLLGQAESGKSTVLRNFQLKFTPVAFEAETAAWRAVIDLNLVRSVRYILDVLGSTADEMHIIPDELRLLRVALSPLRSVEEALASFLASDEHGAPLARSSDSRTFDVKVRGSRWKALFTGGAAANLSRQHSQALAEVLSARRVIEACKEDMMALWAHPAVQQRLEGKSVLLQFQSGFFLDQVERIATPGYQPSSEDVLKARIQTQGVEEHILKMETAESGQTWAIIDVGGSRHQRAAWLPYFDDVNMLIFLAPVSAFDQTLAEDPTVNRMWDSFLIWRSICSSKLLDDVSFILLLNKYDILDAKLKSGSRFSSHVTSYKDRPNDTTSVLTYLKEKFVTIFRQTSTTKRSLHVHFTCATDARATALVLARIREVIFTGNIRNADLL